MNLEPNEEQVMMREMVRGVCAEYAPLDVVREMEDDPTGYPAELWKQLSELGVLGMTILARRRIRIFVRVQGSACTALILGDLFSMADTAIYC